MTELVVATESNFSEKCYLAVNRDVAAAIESGAFTSGFDHFSKLGKFESRLQVADVDSEYFLTEPLTRMIFGQEIESDPRDSILEIGPLNKPLITGKNVNILICLIKMGCKRERLSRIWILKQSHTSIFLRKMVIYL